MSEVLGKFTCDHIPEGDSCGLVVTLVKWNAELRKLVRDMWDFFCVVPDEPHTSKEEIDFSVEVWRRMRELGIEEDE